MKFKLRCKLWGHAFRTKTNIQVNYEGKEKHFKWESADTCYHCGLTKEEAGITVKSNVPMP